MKLVVFVLRGCSVGWLGAYGNEWVVTPDLDRFAAEGVVFDRHVSDSPNVAAARQAWRTGRDQFRPPAEAPGDLLPLLRAHGIFTALVRANRERHDAHPDYYAAWDKVFDARPIPGEPTLHLVDELPTVLDQLSGHADWLLWVELDTLLPPWDVSDAVFEAYVEELLEEGGEADDEPLIPWGNPATGWFDADDLAAWELLHHSFASVVTKLDADLGKVFEQVRAAGAACVVTADAGLPLGEHGLIGPHRPWLHEELVHLPLMVRFPDGAFGGVRVGGFTQPADLMPTVLALFQRPLPADLDGRDLGPLWTGTAETIRPHAITSLSLSGASEVAIRTDEWACLIPVVQHPDDADDPRAATLFVKPDDRCEVNNVAGQKPEVVEAFEREINDALASGGRQPPDSVPHAKESGG